MDSPLGDHKPFVWLLVQSEEMLKKTSGEVRDKQAVQEIRQGIRSYIRDERDTILQKWLALKAQKKAA